MAILDLDSLLAPVSDEEPCGPNLEYDSTYVEFEAVSSGKSEQQYGETIIPGEEPNWLEVRRLGIELLTRSKDLRVGCLLARGLLAIDGFPGFADGLALIHGYLERYWQTVHPQLDAADDNDPTIRVNIVSSLSHRATTVQSLRNMPMVNARVAGRFSLRDFGIASGEIAATEGESPTLAEIEAAFIECDLEELRSNEAAVRESIEHTNEIESIVTQQVGAAQAISFESLRDALVELQAILTEHLSRRVVNESDNVTIAQGITSSSGQDSATHATGEKRSRDDVVRALDQICDYYARYEPSSPLPLLLGRAKRLASKSFLDIVKDLSPDTLSQIRALGGVDREESGE